MPSLTLPPRVVTWNRRNEFLVFALLPFLVALALSWGAAVDDVFINLRYAANVVHGLGPVFNQGTRVQGFTSPLGLVTAIFSYIFSPSNYELFLNKLLTTIIGGVALWRACDLIRWFDFRPVVRRLLFVVVGVNWILAYADGNGLETSLLIWFVLEVSIRGLDPARSFAPATTAAAALVVFTRIDAIGALGVFGLFLLIFNYRTLRECTWFAGAGAALVTTLVAEKLLFGSILPSTYYAKHIPTNRAVHAGLHYLINPQRLYSRPLTETMLLLFVVVGFGAIVALVTRHPSRPLIGLVLGQLIFILATGGDWMPGDRFLAPVVPAMVVLGGVGINWLFSEESWRLAAGIVAAGMLVLSSILPYTVQRHPVTSITGLTNAPLLAQGGGLYESVWLELPQLTSCLAPGARVATTEVGYFGFMRPDLNILDMRGLNDMAIARTVPGYDHTYVGDIDGNWSLPNDPVGHVLTGFHPAVIITNDGYRPALALNGTYRAVRSFGLPTIRPFYIYVPVGTPVPACLLQRLPA